MRIVSLVVLGLLISNPVHAFFKQKTFEELAVCLINYVDEVDRGEFRQDHLFSVCEIDFSMIKQRLGDKEFEKKGYEALSLAFETIFSSGSFVERLRPAEEMMWENYQHGIDALGDISREARNDSVRYMQNISGEPTNAAELKALKREYSLLRDQIVDLREDFKKGNFLTNFMHNRNVKKICEAKNHTSNYCDCLLSTLEQVGKKSGYNAVRILEKAEEDYKSGKGENSAHRFMYGTLTYMDQVRTNCGKKYVIGISHSQ